MTPLFKKLNYKSQECIHILNAPEEFQVEMNEMRKVCSVSEKLDQHPLVFILLFVQTHAEIAQNIAKLKGKIEGDTILWFCYPKGTSKKYKKCEVNRDNAWSGLAELNMEPVRAVAIDNDWSALRFRNVQFIKTLKRNPDWILTEEGKKKAEGD